MNLMILINLLVDISCQIITKCAIVSKSKYFHRLNTPKSLEVNVMIWGSEQHLIIHRSVREEHVQLVVRVSRPRDAVIASGLS